MTPQAIDQETGHLPVLGMVEDFGWQLPRPEEQSAMYQPRPPMAGGRMRLAIRAREPEGFAMQLRTIAAPMSIRLSD